MIVLDTRAKKQKQKKARDDFCQDKAKPLRPPCYPKAVTLDVFEFGGSIDWIDARQYMYEDSYLNANILSQTHPVCSDITVGYRLVEDKQ